MDEDAPLWPWGRLLRQEPRSGYAYPVNNREIATALCRAHADVAEVHLVPFTTGGRLPQARPEGLPVAQVDLQDPSQPYWHTGGDLWIYAVPTDRRGEVHDRLVGEGLPAIAEWLAVAPTRGEAWQHMRHERWVALLDQHLAVVDFEGGDSSTMRAI